ncbi:MAG: DUF4339 domain-containing protein [Thermogutta sp.]
MSSNETYHIRVRGNVLGPFRREQILKLIQRGQVTPMHEVSCDGSDWQPAGQYEDLFPITSSQEPDIERLSMWYYHTAEGEKGPASVWELKQLIAQGVLGPDNEVWREGMAGWQPVRSTELAAYLSSSSEASRGVGDSSSLTPNDRNQLPHALVHPLLDIHSRSLFIGGIWALVATLSLICAALFILGGRLPDSKLILAIIALTNAIYCFVAVFLARDAIFIAGLPHSNDMNDAILARLRTFWLWSAPVSLLVVILYVVLLILGLSSDAQAIR